MRTILATGVLVGLSISLLGCPGNAVVIFEDPELENAVRRELGLYFGFITEADMLDLLALDARNLEIRSLDGLQAAQNLQWLDVSNEARLAGTITDLSPLADLTDLEFLNLENNDIGNVVPLSGLRNLSELYLAGNDVFNLEPLVANAENGGLGPGDVITLNDDVLLDSEGNPVSQRVSDQLNRLLQQGVDVLFVDISESGAQ